MVSDMLNRFDVVGMVGNGDRCEISIDGEVVFYKREVREVRNRYLRGRKMGGVAVRMMVWDDVFGFVFLVSGRKDLVANVGDVYSGSVKVIEFGCVNRTYEDGVLFAVIL
jgi:hypothetical protein